LKKANIRPNAVYCSVVGVGSGCGSYDPPLETVVDTGAEAPVTLVID
jgi:hypothetical protein